MTTLTVHVVGIPQPQGSARAFMHKGARFPVVTHDNANLRGWRKTVAQCARLTVATGRLPRLTGPVRVCAAFFLPRPKALRGPKAHTTRPDLDKLARAILDALTDVVWRDDAQVTELKVTKHYTAVGAAPGAVIAVTTLEEAPLLAVEGTHVATV